MNREFLLEQKDKQIDSLFEELQKIGSLLGGCGVELSIHLSNKERFSEQWNLIKNSGGFVIDDDRNIRGSINNKTGHWRIWFTNELENPDHPLRKQITSALREEGFEVV